MQCYTDLVPPTAVRQALQLAFLGPRANNLVVAKVSLLQIFELKSTITEVASNDGVEESNAAVGAESEAADMLLQRTEYTSKLVLIGEYPLSGTVLSIARIKTRGLKAGGEALLVHFRDARMSLVQWDPETYNLDVSSLHYYENADVLDEPWAPDLGNCYNFLTADPSSRCAALKFGTRNLAILPFNQSEDEDLDNNEGWGGAPNGTAKAKPANGEGQHKVPYSKSFVLPLTRLDPTLSHPVHLAFLHEYREPTFGIISSSQQTATSLLHERKDILTYSVFTLDLAQGASTTLITVSGLPYDLSRIVSLPMPIGGALLLGDNEVIHVDQNGRTNGIAVNEFAKIATSFTLSDQTDLALRLEGCVVELLAPDTGDVLIILNSGDFFVLRFTLDGRSVSRMTLHRVSDTNGGKALQYRASCTAPVGRGKIFIGSEDGDSILLGWTNKQDPMSIKRDLDEEGSSADEEEFDDLDDDLYNDTPATIKKTKTVNAKTGDPSDYKFRIHDSLPSLAPIKDVTFPTAANSPPAQGPKTPVLPKSPVDILASTGAGRAGALTVLNSELQPTVLTENHFSSARGLWSVIAKKKAPKGVISEGDQDAEGDMAGDADYDQYLVVCKASANGNEDTVVYQVRGTSLRETAEGDFEREDGATMDVGVLGGGTKIVQVLRTEIRTYDSDLNMEQLVPIEDEETGAELRIIHASFADPYLLVLTEDSTVKFFKCTTSGELDELDSGTPSSFKWLSASAFSSPTIPGPMAFLLSPEGGLHIYAFSDLSKPSYVAEGLSYLPAFLTPEYAPRRASARATLTEILVANLGDATSKSPYLIIRTSTDDLHIYKPFHYPARPSSSTEPFTSGLRWIKLPQPHLPRFSEEPALESEDVGKESTLVRLDNVGGYSAVFQRGAAACFILKEASSAPRVINMNSNAVKSMTRFHTAACDRGFAYLDIDDNVRICKFPENTRYGDLGWAARKIPMAEEIWNVAYHPRGVYVMSSSQLEEYTLPEDSYHHEWALENTTFKPTVETGVLKVMDVDTETIIDTHIFDPQEIILCVEVLNLEVSETSHERRPLVAVGTSIVKGEDLVTKGRIHIFEVITVVPEPGRPETNRKLRLIAKEEVKGAVTRVAELGTQGFLIMAQGQKCMVRGLKEDGTLLPVAFMDMQCYVTVLKSLGTSGMVLMGDAFKGLWFTGYTEEPYKMMLFGKSRTKLEVMDADFLPFERTMHFIIADADGNLIVLQFDPDQPKSVSGQRLLLKSTFHTGHFPTTLNLLKGTLKMPLTADLPGGAGNPMSPSGGTAAPGGDPMDTDDPSRAAPPLHQLLLTSQSGSISLLTPLSEHTYRRLLALSSFLSNTLDHPCGLNPKAYRAVEGDFVAAGTGTGTGSNIRGVIDGNLVLRWGELNEQKRREGLVKCGAAEWVVKGEREVLLGRGVFGGRV